MVNKFNIWYEIQYGDCESQQCAPLDTEVREHLHKCLDEFLDHFDEFPIGVNEDSPDDEKPLFSVAPCTVKGHKKKG